MGYKYGKVWVAGASGRVGTMIKNILDTRDVDLFETDKDELDITDAEAVNRYGLRYIFFKYFYFIKSRSIIFRCNSNSEYIFIF